MLQTTEYLLCYRQLNKFEIGPSKNSTGL